MLKQGRYPLHRDLRALNDVIDAYVRCAIFQSLCNVAKEFVNAAYGGYGG
jgi:hypothetical protein